MAAEIINTKQKSTLKTIVAQGKVDLSTKIDKRTVNALEVRGLVKTSESKKGAFVAPTAKGKKYFN
jgi:predicted transcriptional regulator